MRYLMEFSCWSFLHSYKEEQFQWVIRDFFTHTETVQEVTHESSSFTIDFTSYILRLSRSDRFDVWSLYIISENENLNLNALDYIILGLKKLDGSLDEVYMRKTDTGVGKEYLLNYWTNSELLERKHELTSSDDLTVTLTSKRRVSVGKTTSKCPRFIFNGLPSWKLIKLDTLSEDFKNLFADNGSCDVILKVQHKVFNAHKAVLVARSPVFAAMFEHDMKESKTGIVNIPDCDPESFYKFLEYVYCGKLEDISFPIVFHLYSISNKYDVQELKSFCEQYMEQHLTEDNICDVIILAEMNDDAKLLSFAREFFYKNCATIINTPNWKNMMEEHSDLINRLILEMASKIVTTA